MSKSLPEACHNDLLNRFVLFRTGNEAEVGAGIKASGVPREEIFLVTKLDNIDHKEVPEALEASLKKLDTPYIDLCTSVNRKREIRH